MKRIMSVVLSLLLVFSLCGAMSLSAFAEEGENGGEVTVLVTGGVGKAVGGEGLGYASAASLKSKYEGRALLVDAGGFDLAAADIMAAAGYDLAVPDKAIEGWSVPSISMGLEELSAGATLTVSDVKIAFVGVVPMGETETAEDYYAAIQKVVETASAANYVIALGNVENPEALAENVTGLTAILTYGPAAEDAAGTETVEGEEAPAEETEAGDTPEEAPEEAAEGETPAEETPEESAPEETPAEEAPNEEAPGAKTVIVRAGEGFASIGVLTIGADGVTGGAIDAAAYKELGLPDNPEIRAMEEKFEPATEGEEAPAEGEEPVEGEEAPAEGEQPAEGEEAPAEGEQPAEGEEAPVEGEEPTENNESNENEVPAAANGGLMPANEEQNETPAEGGESENNEEPAAEGEEQNETPNEANETNEATAQAQSPAANAAANGEDENPDNTVEPTPTAAAAQEEQSISWTRGTADLVFNLEHPVDYIVILNNNNKMEKDCYTLSEDGKTVTILASVLNKWGDGNFQLEFHFTDNTAAEKKTFTISGTAPAETAAANSDSPSNAAVDNNSVAWVRGTGDLKFTLSGKVTSVTVGKDGKYVLEEKYYDKSEDGKTVSIHADALDSWQNASYTLNFNLEDGTTETKTVTISGEVPANTAAATDTPSPSPSATAAGTNPNTGDETPIGIWIAVLAILVVVVAVIVIILVRRNRKK